jgi:hypothetical protein
MPPTIRDNPRLRTALERLEMDLVDYQAVPVWRRILWAIQGRRSDQHGTLAQIRGAIEGRYDNLP